MEEKQEELARAWKGETEPDPEECKGVRNTDPNVTDTGLEEQEDSSDNVYPLLFFYDCETTGFSVYNEHISELAAKVHGVPLSSGSKPTYSSLIKTSRHISKPGTCIQTYMTK